MKKALLFAAAMAVTLVVAKVPATKADAPKAVTPDWHYRWHEGRWWYWMPESGSWMVWIGSTWVPYEEVADCPNVLAVSRAVPCSVGYGSYETEGESGTADPAYPDIYESSYSTGSGVDYSGYGWGWGPGTAFRGGPGRRF